MPADQQADAEHPTVLSVLGSAQNVPYQPNESDLEKHRRATNNPPGRNSKNDPAKLAKWHEKVWLTNGDK